MILVIRRVGLAMGSCEEQRALDQALANEVAAGRAAAFRMIRGKHWMLRRIASHGHPLDGRMAWLALDRHESGDEPLTEAQVMQEEVT